MLACREMGAEARILAAVPPPAFPFLERALGGHVRLIPCHTYDDATRRLRRDEGLALVICGVYFDRSRMFELLQYADGRLPFICCRILPFETPAISVEALRIACESLGAVFLDLPSLQQRCGADGADAQLLSHVLRAMEGGRRPAGQAD